MQHEVWKRPSCYQTWSGCCQLHTNLCARSQYIQQQRFPYPLVALPSTGTSRKIPVSCLDLNPYHEVCCICVSAQPGIKAGSLLLAYFKAIHIFINNNNFSYADNLQELNENCYRKQQRWSVICQPATSSCLSKCCKLLPVLLSVQALGRQESFQGKEQHATCKQGERLCSAQHWCPDSLLSPCCRWKSCPLPSVLCHEDERGSAAHRANLRNGNQTHFFLCMYPVVFWQILTCLSSNTVPSVQIYLLCQPANDPGTKQKRGFCCTLVACIAYVMNSVSKHQKPADKTGDGFS